MQPSDPSSGKSEPEISEFRSEILQADPQQAVLRAEECGALELSAAETPQPSSSHAIRTEECVVDERRAADSMHPDPASQPVLQTILVPDISEERSCLDTESSNARDALPEAPPLSCNSNSVFNILRLSFHKFVLFPPLPPLHPPNHQNRVRPCPPASRSLACCACSFFS